jgi:hypothetical protein
MKYLTLVMFAIAFLPPGAHAQRGAAGGVGSGGHPAVHFSGSAHGLAFGRGERNSDFRRSSPYLPYSSLPFPFFGDSFDPDNIYSTGYPVAAEPPAYVLEAARVMAGRNSNFVGSTIGGLSSGREPAAPQPILIELQNDGHYARVNGGADQGDAEPLSFSRSTNQPSAVAAESVSQARTSVVLIYRDGHSEEVRDYTIADGMLYARGDFYTDGYWNKKIGLASLDLPQTLQANASRNVKFDLPSSPNEVITRF